MNSSDRIAVQRYASAYDQLSHSTEEASARAADLSAAVQALAGAQNYMTSPRVSLPAKKQAVREALSGTAQTAVFVELLLDAKRYNLLEAIAKQVNFLLDERLGIIRAEVYAARELSAAQKQKAQESLSARYGGKVAATFYVDPALLGGLKIRCRGELIDGSLQGKLAKLQEELIK